MFQGADKTEFRRGNLESRDRFAAAPPGISLTTDNEKWPWGNPPQEVDVDVILEQATGRIEDDDIFRDELFKILAAGISVEHIVEAWVIDGFEEGKFSLDAGLLAKAPLAMYIAYIAEENDVPYRMFEREDINEDRRMDNRDYLNVMKTNNPNMFAVLKENMNKLVRTGLDALDEVQNSPPQQQPQQQERGGFMTQEAPPEEVQEEEEGGDS